MGTLLGLLVVGALLLLPLLALKILFSLVAGLVMLPFRVLGAALKAAFGIVGLVFKVLFSGAGLVVSLLAIVFGIILIPLLPLALLAGVLWTIARAGRPRARLHPAA